MTWWTRPKTRAAACNDGRVASLMVSGREVHAVLAEIDGGGALVSTTMRPPVPSSVSLRHPQAGAIVAEVIGVEHAGLRLRFDRSERAIGFALAIVAAGAAARS